ncbi:endonuclease III [Janthinobacterium phage vB_JliS-Donnerlittchen]|uniref:Endonuclease III n=1 Tax=Janthinobacterium phage vB_JliS-Donnerlittchen TaxID=2948610 RepID=A0A9E7MPU9_9CAUD|nr:endonuclease III [Janthinobacterium phage vB_JliM-Donnerlittchen]USN14433.1 endonuclease III [Janthinobacterium phage vB_JliM-Donnerlittchen]
MRTDRWRPVRRGRLTRLEYLEGDEPADGELFQERLRETPFWMLVACSLVNLTTWQQARPALDLLMARYPRPEDLAAAQPEDLHDVLRPLGLWRRRAVSLVGLAVRWLGLPAGRVNIQSLPGCGRYAADSWAIFVEGRTDVEPTDGKLSWYLSNLKL